jgi:hypothetical protein
LAFEPDFVGQANIFLEIHTFDNNSLVFFDDITLTVLCFDCVSQGFGAFDLAQRHMVQEGVICANAVFPCVTTLEFIDSHGVLLKQANLNLRPGESGFLDLPSTAQGREPMEVTPRWFLHQGSATFSLEVSDETDLRTRFFANWADGSVSKTGNLSSGPVSLTRGDTGRLKVYRDGSVRVEGTLRVASCQGDLAFHDVNGRVLKQSHLDLAPGTAGFLDLTFEETRSSDRRMEVVPSLTVTGGLPSGTSQCSIGRRESPSRSRILPRCSRRGDRLRAKRAASFRLFRQGVGESGSIRHRRRRSTATWITRPAKRTGPVGCCRPSRTGPSGVISWALRPCRRAGGKRLVIEMPVSPARSRGADALFVRRR